VPFFSATGHRFYDCAVQDIALGCCRQARTGYQRQTLNAGRSLNSVTYETWWTKRRLCTKSNMPSVQYRERSDRMAHSTNQSSEFRPQYRVCHPVASLAVLYWSFDTHQDSSFWAKPNAAENKFDRWCQTVSSLPPK